MAICHELAGYCLQLRQINFTRSYRSYSWPTDSWLDEEAVQYDIVIIGAGPAGLSFARSLVGTGLEVLVVEKSSLSHISEPVPDGREIALTHLSVKLLQECGVWSRIPANAIVPITQARVLNGNSGYSLDIGSRRDVGNVLGHIVSNHLIRKALYDEVVTGDHVRILPDVVVDDVSTDRDGASVNLSSGDTVTASLVVAADSRFSGTRRKMGIPARMQDFSRVAIVCRMEHEYPHHGIATECFHYDRTLAVLPLAGNSASIVITVPANLAREVVDMDEAGFNVDIQRRFNNRLGWMRLAGKRYPYPLIAVHADRFVANRFALIGDAAVGMHPVTAHGFNLGLRGQKLLAREVRLALSEGRDFASLAVLGKYESGHMQVTRPMYLGTNGIVNLFTDDAPSARALRSLVLRLANNFPPIKQLITRSLTGKAGPAHKRLPFLP